MMKKYISIIFITLAVAGSSCKKDYLNLQTNPNVPSAASPGLLLSGALKGTADIVNGPNMGTIQSGGVNNTVGSGYVQYAAWSGYLSQSTGFQPFVALEEYQFTTSSYDDWTPNYLNISNYNSILTATTEPYYQAIAKMMIAFDFESLVDNYNNVPYTSALKGTANLNPTYDKGPDIYADLFKQLDAAIALIQKAPATALNPGASDIMFGGTMNNWIKFANTLKLRLAIHLSNQNSAITANPALVLSALKTEIASTNGTVGYLDETTPATVNPGFTNSDASGGQQSPLWRNYGTFASGSSQTNNNEYQANSYLANYLAANKDARLIQVYTATSDPATVKSSGLTPGSAINLYPRASDDSLVAVISTTFGDSQPPTSSTGLGLTPSKVGTGVLPSASMSAAIISSEEALFLQSEAAYDGYDLGVGKRSAEAYYEAGITTSFINMNAQVISGGSVVDGAQVGGTALSPTASAAALYAPGAPYAFPTGNPQQAIITQKWIALSVGGSFEAFNEIRRTGFPNVPTSIYPGADAPNQVTRIFYPFVEYQTNATNVAAQGTIDKFTSKIFWAK
jgi:hypothetical protein